MLSKRRVTRGLALTIQISAATNCRCSSDPAASVFPLQVYSDEQVQSAAAVTRDVAAPVQNAAAATRDVAAPVQNAAAATRDVAVAQNAAAATRDAVVVQSVVVDRDAGSRIAAVMTVAPDSRHADDQRVPDEAAGCFSPDVPALPVALDCDLPRGDPRAAGQVWREFRCHQKRRVVPFLPFPARFHRLLHDRWDDHRATWVARDDPRRVRCSSRPDSASHPNCG